jgi:tetratricopeptide (TPR) repeat protein
MPAMMRRLFFLVVCLPSFVYAESIPFLYEQANAVLSRSDYVSGAYYLNRIMDSPEWASYPGKVNVLGRMGGLHESQADFETAARYYKQIYDELHDQPDHPQQSFYRYYAQRYAECLERAGFYKQAATVFWNLVYKDDGSIEPIFLRRLVQNFAFQEPPADEMTRIHALIIPTLLDRCGWDLANLYRVKGQFTDSYQLYEMLWQQYPQQAQAHVDSMYQVYKTLHAIEEWLTDIYALHEQQKMTGFYILLASAVLELDDRAAESLTLIEDYLSDGNAGVLPHTTANLVGRFTSPVLDQWVDLIEKVRGPDAAISILDTLVTQSPMESSRRERLSNMLVRIGKKEEAIRVWLDWTKIQSNNPLALLHSAEVIHSLGGRDTATMIMDQTAKTISPNLAYNHAYTALRLEMYEQALASFEVAQVTGQQTDQRIYTAINQFADQATNVGRLAAALIASVSQNIQNPEMPNWLRDSALNLAVKQNMNDELESLAAADFSGQLTVYLAQEAQKQGRNLWAVELLRSVPEDSPYLQSAQLQLAALLGRGDSIESSAEAARLLKPALATIVQSTDALTLPAGQVERLLRYIELSLQSYQPVEALIAIRRIESPSTMLSVPLTAPQQEQILYFRAQTLVQLSSLQPAIELFDSITVEPYASRARWIKSRVLVAQRKSEEARIALQEMIADPACWRVANDALSLYMALEPLVGGAQRLFCDAMLYQLQGRFEDAVPLFRQIAVDYYADDIEEWARYQIGLLEKMAGNKETAREEWQRLTLDADHPVIHGLTRYELLHLRKPVGVSDQDGTAYQELLLDFPNTIFSDLARLENP